MKSSESGFTINLVSNASMSTFPDNTLAHFTTLLPEQINLEGIWEVAVVEISWSELIQNVTEGTFSFQLVNQAIAKPLDIRRPTLSSTSGMVTMYDPRKRKHSADETYQAEQIDSISPGCYPTIDTLLESIFRRVCVKAEWDFATLPVKWSVCPVSHLLRVDFKGTAKEKMKVKAISKDLRSILGVCSIIDCSTNVDEQQDEKRHKKNQSNSRATDQYPTDLRGGCHTMFLYCDLVHNEILGDTQSALLRAIPLSSSKANHRSFSKLQWRRLIKCTIQSITISLRSETGSFIPFLSRGRTNLTLQFKRCTKSG